MVFPVIFTNDPLTVKVEGDKTIFTRVVPFETVRTGVRVWAVLPVPAGFTPFRTSVMPVPVPLPTPGDTVRVDGDVFVEVLVGSPLIWIVVAKFVAAKVPVSIVHPVVSVCEAEPLAALTGVRKAIRPCVPVPVPVPAESESVLPVLFVLVLVGSGCAEIVCVTTVVENVTAPLCVTVPASV